ncbi:MAG: hypothetical protein RLP44_15880 [Aggregatilineales bacterium]
MRTYRLSLVLALLVLAFAPFARAQNEADAEGWRVIENCLGELQYPIIRQGNWDFPGVIISSVYPEGVRAIRADQNVDYYLALESDSSFPTAGMLSPNGRYFAYPTGISERGDFSSLFLTALNLKIVRTDGNTDEVHLSDASSTTFVGMGGGVRPPVFTLDQPRWFGNNFVYYRQPLDEEETHLIDFATDERIIWANSIYPFQLNFISPNATRAFTDTLYNLVTDEALPFPKPQNVIWFPDSSAFIASNDTITLVNRDGETLDTIFPAPLLSGAISPGQNFFSFWDSNQNLYIADMSEQIVYDLCFTGMADFYYLYDISGYPNLAWSPDGLSLAFSYDNYLVLLDIQTFETQVIDHFSKIVMGWGTLEGEDIQVSNRDIRLGQRLSTLAEATRTMPAPTQTPPPIDVTAEVLVTSCPLEVVNGANLRAGAGADTERAGSAAIGFELVAVAQQFNQTEYFIWWQLDTGEWIREDFVREGEECTLLPEFEASGP